MPSFPRLSAALALGGVCSALAVRAVAADATGPADVAPSSGSPAVDGPSVEEQAAYRDVVTRAVAEFDARHFAEARALFLRAHELWPSARTLRTLGMTAFELRLYPLALSELEAALADARRPLPDVQRAQVLALIERARAFVGRYTLRLSPPAAELLVDGAPRSTPDSLLVLAVGEHELVVRAPGYRELRRVVVVEGRETEELALTLETARTDAKGVSAPGAPPPPPPASTPLLPRADTSRPDRSAAIGALAVGGVGLVTAAVFVGLTLRDERALDGKCPGDVCPPEQHATNDEMHAFASVATVGSVVGLLGVGIGTYLWVSGRSSTDRVALRWQPVVGPGSAGVNGTF